MPRRLSLLVGVSTSESGSHSSPSSVNSLICSTWANCSLIASTPCWIRAAHVGVVGQLGQRLVGLAVGGRPHRGDLGVEHQQRRDELAGVADRARLADERDHLQGGLEVRRADVLAARRDDQLLLAVDDLEVALVVDHADVAGVQPAVDHRLGGLVGLLEVALEDVAAAATTSPSSAIATSMPGIAWPT